MGLIQAIAPNLEQALQTGLAIASRIAACGPLGIRTTLASAHLAIDESDAVAFSQLNEQYAALYRTADFVECRKAEADGRPPVYVGTWAARGATHRSQRRRWP